MSRLGRNKGAIERYVTLLQPKLERQTGGMINMEELDRPESTPPLTDTALDLIHNTHNTDARQKLEPIFRDMVLSGDDTQGYMLKLLGAAGLRQGDPGLVRRWRAGETEDDRLLASFFERAIKWVAAELERRHPGVEIKVTLDPEDDPVNSPREANDRRRIWARKDSYRLIGAEVQRVIEEEDATVEGAKELVSQRENKRLATPCSRAKVHKAWLFYQNEQRESA
jgi:hypothetical protein